MEKNFFDIKKIPGKPFGAVKDIWNKKRLRENGFKPAGSSPQYSLYCSKNTVLAVSPDNTKYFEYTLACGESLDGFTYDVIAFRDVTVLHIKNKLTKKSSSVFFVSWRDLSRDVTPDVYIINERVNVYSYSNEPGCYYSDFICTASADNCYYIIVDFFEKIIKISGVSQPRLYANNSRDKFRCYKNPNKADGKTACFRNVFKNKLKPAPGQIPALAVHNRHGQ